jgi:hypothetical protein
VTFANCSSLASVIIGNRLESIGERVFSNCSNLASVIIGNRVESIGSMAFADCSSLRSINIGSNVTKIGSDAFRNCSSLRSMTIGSGVTDIGPGAFYACSSLESVTIPGSVTDIGVFAFAGCGSLALFTNLNPAPQEITADVFMYVNIGNATLHVPAGSVEDYKKAPVWKDFGTIKEYMPSAIHVPLTMGDVRIYPSEGTLRIEGLIAPTTVTASNTKGETVFRQALSGDTSIATGDWPKGVYLIRINGKTVKTVK